MRKLFLILTLVAAVANSSEWGGEKKDDHLATPSFQNSITIREEWRPWTSGRGGYPMDDRDRERALLLGQIARFKSERKLAVLATIDAPEAAWAIKSLHEEGMDLNTPDEHGFLPLHCSVGAVGDGAVSESQIKFLLRLGADPNKQEFSGGTALHRLLSSCSMRRDVFGAEGGRVLRILQSYWSLLCEHGADPLIKDSDYDKTAQEGHDALVADLSEDREKS